MVYHIYLLRNLRHFRQVIWTLGCLGLIYLVMYTKLYSRDAKTQSEATQQQQVELIADMMEKKVEFKAIQKMEEAEDQYLEENEVTSDNLDDLQSVVFFDRNLAKTVTHTLTGKVKYVTGSDYIEAIKRDSTIMRRLKELDVTNLLFQHYKYADHIFQGAEIPETQSLNEEKSIVVVSNKPSRFSRSTCEEVTPCRVVSTSTSNIAKADAVVFDARSLPVTPPSRHNPNQVFVYMSEDGLPNDAPVTYRNYFNWTLTSRLDSDIPIPSTIILPSAYKESIFVKEGLTTGAYNDVHLHDLFKHDSKKALRRVKSQSPGKDHGRIYAMKNSAQSFVRINTDCEGMHQNSVLQNLEQFMKIDKINLCGSDPPYMSPCLGSDITCISRTYKFVLINDPSTCDDHISTFIRELYQEDIVLVLEGSSKFTKTFPAQTYIDVSEFESVAKLGAFLTTLSSDKNMYTDYLELRDKFVVMKDDAIASLALCRLCYKLNNLRWYEKPAINITQWLNTC